MMLFRVFDIDLEHCPNCGGELKIIAAILEQPVIEKILTHLGLLLARRALQGAVGTCAWTGPAGDLSAIKLHRSRGLAPRVAGIGCARGFQHRGEATWPSG